MQIEQVKKVIYIFIKNQLCERFPKYFKKEHNNAVNNVFWAKSKAQKPCHPYVELDDIFKVKIHKRFENYEQDDKDCIRQQFRMTVTFRVCTMSADGRLIDGENLADEIIEFLSDLLSSSPETFAYFDEEKITINELEMSQIIDLTNFNFTNNEYKKQFNIPFEYEDIKEKDLPEGQIVKAIIYTSAGSEPIEIEEKQK